jgi:hypothetical protein
MGRIMTDDPRTSFEFGADQEKFEACIDQMNAKPQRLGQGRWLDPRKLCPYPAQLLCLGYIGDPDHDGIREWCWVPVRDDDDDECLIVRCQDAAHADFGWFPLRRLRLVDGPP